MLEKQLPPPLLAKATRSGTELAWSLADVPEVIDAAEAVALANLGGQPQFIYPDATYEPYWLSADSGEQREGETWTAYVRRSAAEVRAAFERIRSEVDFEAEARRFSFLTDKLEQNEPIMPHLFFVLYFASEAVE